MALTDEQLERYSRHIILKEVGAKGQKKLLEAKVLIIGAGGLGAPAAMYLAAAGVGTIGIADFDEVSVTNLNSQVIHGTRDINRPKAASAKDSIRAINPLVKVETYQENGKLYAKAEPNRTEPIKLWGAQVVEKHTDATPGTVIAAGKQGIDVACGELQHVLRILELQPPGKKRMSAADYLRGHPIQVL